MRSKYEILTMRRRDLLQSPKPTTVTGQVERLEKIVSITADLDWMDRTPFPQDLGTRGYCDCGFHIVTEADFAKHFVIPDERYLNLGNCPVKP